MNNIKLKIKNPLDERQESLNTFLTENPIFKLGNNSLFLDRYKKLLTRDLLSGVVSNDFNHMLLESNKNFEYISPLFMVREFYTNNFGFTLISQEFLNQLTDYLKDKNVLDMGAGAGFLSKNLHDSGIKIKAVDQSLLENNPYQFSHSHFPTFTDNGKDYMQSMGKAFNTIILSWPNYDTSFATEILNEMSVGQELIYIGEGYGGCTADDSFWDLIEHKAVINETATKKLRNGYVSFPSIHDTPYVFTITA